MNRTRRWVVCSLMLLVATSSMLHAQTPGVAPTNKQPVMVVSFASTDGLLNDINHLTTVIGMPQFGNMAQIYVGGFGQGLDKSQPVGITVRMINNQPVPMMFVAIADVKGFLKRLEQQLGPADELGDGTLVIQVGPRLIYVRDQGDWAFIANEREALSELPDDPKSLLQGLHQNHDIGIMANVQQIPAPIRDSLVDQVRMAYEKGIEKLKEQNGGKIQPGMNNDSALKQIEMFMSDSEYLTLGITVDQEQNELAFDFAMTAVQGSALANLCNARKSIPSQFSGFIRPDATVFTHVATAIGPEEQAMAISSMKQSIVQARGVVEQQLEMSDDVVAKIDTYLPRIESLVESNIRTGKINGGFLTLTENNRLQVLGGWSVAKGKDIEQVVKDIVHEFRNNPDAPRFQFDAGSYKGLTLHRGTVSVPNANPELSKVFGDSLPILIATSEDRLYVGVGQNIEALFQQTVDASATAAASKLPLSHGMGRLLPALQYADWVAENSVTDLLLKTIQSNAQHDQIRFVQPTEPDGQRVRMTIDDGVLQVIGAALQTKRQPADQF